MYRENFYYENNLGEVVRFGSGGLFADANDIRDYSWKTETNGDRITGFSRTQVMEKTLPVVVTAKKRSQWKQIREHAFATFEKDVIAAAPGKLWLNGYYLRCFIVAAENTNYWQCYGRAMNTTWTIVSDNAVWRRDIELSYPPSAEESDGDGIDYPYDYPYDYASRLSGVRTIENPSLFESDFKLTFWGPAEEPSITINGHKYAVMKRLMSGERVEIDSMRKTVTHYSASGLASNWIAYRYKQESIFEKIPAGTVPVLWDGSFGFDIVIRDERSEPVFEER